MNKEIEYKLREVSNNHLVIDFISNYTHLGFIEIWNGNNVIYTNDLFDGLDIKRAKKIIKIANRLLILNKLRLLKKR